MKIILLKNIKHLGEKGKVIEVKSGYARNYLIPTEKALLANKKNMQFLKNQQNEITEKNKIQISESKLRIKKIKSITPINIFVQSKENGKLFGSIGIREIVNAIKKLNFSINKNEISLPNGPIKKIGTYEVLFHPHKMISKNFCVHIVSKK